MEQLGRKHSRVIGVHLDQARGAREGSVGEIPWGTNRDKSGKNRGQEISVKLGNMKKIVWCGEVVKLQQVWTQRGNCIFQKVITKS